MFNERYSRGDAALRWSPGENGRPLKATFVSRVLGAAYIPETGFFMRPQELLRAAFRLNWALPGQGWNCFCYGIGNQENEAKSDIFILLKTRHA